MWLKTQGGQLLNLGSMTGIGITAAKTFDEHKQCQQIVDRIEEVVREDFGLVDVMKED